MLHGQDEVTPAGSGTAPANSVVAVQCPQCDYDLHGSLGENCPSCGWRIDYQVLLAAEPASHAKRYAVALTAGVVGVGSLIAMASLAARGKRLNLFDGFIVLSVALASAGHLSLAAVSLLHRQRWPLHRGAAADLIRFAAVLSLLLGMLGAAQFLSNLPASRVVRGVQVSGVLEFVVAALFLLMPGAMLLILRLVSFTEPRLKPATLKGHAASSLPVRASFCVDLIRRSAEDAVSTLWSATSSVTTAPSLESLIARTWKAQTALAGEAARQLYDGRLVRLARWQAAESLRLDLEPTSFRQFVGTNLYNAAQVLAEHPGGLANALGVSAVVMCVDHVLAFGRRSDRVLFHAGYLHTFGGLVEESDVRPDATVDVFGAMRRELSEEAGVSMEEIRDATILGLVRDRELLQPELIFEMSLRITSRELRARFDPAATGQEHGELVFLFDEPDAVVPFLRRMSPVAPVAEAAILLHGRQAFGLDWYEQTCYVLYGELPPTCGVARSADR